MPKSIQRVILNVDNLNNSLKDLWIIFITSCMILKVLALRQFMRVPCIHFIHGSAKHIVIVQYVANRTITIQHPAYAIQHKSGSHTWLWRSNVRLSPNVNDRKNILLLQCLTAPQFGVSFNVEKKIQTQCINYLHFCFVFKMKEQFPLLCFCHKEKYWILTKEKNIETVFIEWRT